MIRIAAVGDVHFGTDSRGQLSQCWKDLESKASALLIAGDLTKIGKIEEAEVLAKDLSECPVPVVLVLGNHDYHQDKEHEIMQCLSEAGAFVLDQASTVLKIHSKSIGIYGAKGFGGGFIGRCASEFGEPQMKSFVAHTRNIARSIVSGLQILESDYKLALLHYSPVPDTLLGEPKEIYPFLGSYLLAEAVDAGGANAVFHGHAHKGVEHGLTAGGVPVRNVAQPVIQKAFKIYSLDEMAEDLRTVQMTSP